MARFRADIKTWDVPNRKEECQMRNLETYYDVHNKTNDLNNNTNLNLLQDSFRISQ
jgi:hypothetical protein